MAAPVVTGTKEGHQEADFSRFGILIFLLLPLPLLLLLLALFGGIHLSASRLCEHSSCDKELQKRKINQGVVGKLFVKKKKDGRMITLCPGLPSFHQSRCCNDEMVARERNRTSCSNRTLSVASINDRLLRFEYEMLLQNWWKPGLL